MEFIGAKDDGTILKFVDKKRWLWLASLVFALLPLSAFALYFLTDNHTGALWLPIILFFAVIPFLDMIIGGDKENPPEEIVPALSKDKFYDKVAYTLIPAHFLLFFVTTWFVGTQSLPLWAIAILAIGIGTINGNLINIGHELGHKTDKQNRFFAKLALALSGYGHFTIEHNRGHHLKVATPEDTASSRFGETVYAFALRELPGALMGGWQQEIKRLQKKNLPTLHWKNEILQVYAVTSGVTATMIFLFGWTVMPFILAHHFFSWYGLTQVNYIEHYGLLRQKRDNGKYEACQPKHSWNSNHRISNLLSLHLQRHSDHHANPMRPYQALRDFEDVPTLPTGYPGCIVMAAIPPLWFKVMNPKVIEWADGDMAKVNIG